MASATRPRKVLLFGLSANPPTGLKGHMGIVKHCQSMYDEIWLIPVYHHIYSNKRELALFEHRMEMCRLALKALKSSEEHGGAELKVMDEERELYEHMATKARDAQELRLGSIDLVYYLLEKYPDTSFTLLLGGDTYADLVANKWKKGHELMQLAHILVVDRQGVESLWKREKTNDDQMTRVQYIHVPKLSDVSSTIVRATADQKELATYLDPAVLDYIIQHQLYAFAKTSE